MMNTLYYSHKMYNQINQCNRTQLIIVEQKSKN